MRVDSNRIESYVLGRAAEANAGSGGKFKNGVRVFLAKEMCVFGDLDENLTNLITVVIRDHPIVIDAGIAICAPLDHMLHCSQGLRSDRRLTPDGQE